MMMHYKEINFQRRNMQSNKSILHHINIYIYAFEFDYVHLLRCAARLFSI